MASSRRTRGVLRNAESRERHERYAERLYLHVFLSFLRGMGTNTQSRIAPTHSNNHTVND